MCISFVCCRSIKAFYSRTSCWLGSLAMLFSQRKAKEKEKNSYNDEMMNWWKTFVQSPKEAKEILEGDINKTIKKQK